MPQFSHILDPIIHPLQAVLVFLTGALHSYGLAIILFTILVRGALAPLNLRQLKSAKKMSALGPRIKEIQQRYKGDREAITREQMALYKEEGVNPAAGCLPLLLQMPILYSLFFIFQNLAGEKGAQAAIYHAHFLWFSLDHPDKLFGHFILGNSFWGPLPLLAASTQWVQQRMMMQPTSDPQQRSTQQIMQFMPLMIMLFAVNYPAGLALYWVTSTVFSIVMQYFITGWGQLFKSPFKVPEAPAPPAAPSRRQAVSEPRANATRTNANGARANGAGRRATFFTAAPTVRAADDAGGTDGDGQLASGGTGGNGARQGQGKMQRTVARQKARSSKGARR